MDKNIERDTQEYLDRREAKPTLAEQLHGTARHGTPLSREATIEAARALETTVEAVRILKQSLIVTCRAAGFAPPIDTIAVADAALRAAGALK